MIPRGRVWRYGVFPSIPGVKDAPHTGKPRWYWCCIYCLEFNLTHGDEYAEAGGCALTAADGNNYIRSHTAAHHADGPKPKYTYKFRRVDEGLRR